MAKNKKHWLHKEIPLEKWMHEQLDLRGETELIIFMAWGLIVSAFLINFI